MCQKWWTGRSPRERSIAAAASSPALIACWNRSDDGVAVSWGARSSIVVQQRGADAPPPVLGVDDAPGPRDVRLLERDLCVPDDLPGVVDRHPGVGGEVAHPAPLPSHEVLAQHDLSAVVELVGDDHVGHRIEVTRRWRSEPVSVGKLHAGSVYTCATAARGAPFALA